MRGIISAALWDVLNQSCDSNNYAVFTDVAIFTEWIDYYMDYYS
jgi:hypothetical protein